MQTVVSRDIERDNRPGLGSKELRSLPEEQKKALIVAALSSQGYRPTDAAALLNIQRSYVAKVSAKDKQGLLAPLAKIARKSIKAMAQGQAVGSMTEIKGSDVLGACKEIMSRAEPIVNKQEIRSTSLHIDITSEDMARIDALMGRRMSDIQAPQDIVIEAKIEQAKVINMNDNNEIQAEQT